MFGLSQFLEGPHVSTTDRIEHRSQITEVTHVCLAHALASHSKAGCFVFEDAELSMTAELMHAGSTKTQCRYGSR